MADKKYDRIAENISHSVPNEPTSLMELLSKATSAHELPESMFSKDGGLSDEKAILLIMRHLEDFNISSLPETK